MAVFLQEAARRVKEDAARRAAAAAAGFRLLEKERKNRENAKQRWD